MYVYVSGAPLAPCMVTFAMWRPCRLTNPNNEGMRQRATRRPGRAAYALSSLQGYHCHCPPWWHLTPDSPAAAATTTSVGRVSPTCHPACTAR